MSASRRVRTVCCAQIAVIPNSRERVKSTSNRRMRPWLSFAFASDRQTRGAGVSWLMCLISEARMSETRKLAAILVSDVAGYCRLAGAEEERILARLRTLRSDLIDPTIAVHHGRS